MKPRAVIGASPHALALAVLATSAFGCDPVKTDAIDALAGNAPGVRNGPLHRPGEPCLLCHDGDLGDPPAFSVAGTVFEEPNGMVGEDDATVLLTDSAGTMYMATTNTAGNFYVTPSQWSPVFPLTQVGVVSTAGTMVTMHSEVGRSGACATCHVAPVGPSSPGPVCITLDDGGVPP
jgi:hypothetical protein